jgi:hypothetical protein
MSLLPPPPSVFPTVSKPNPVSLVADSMVREGGLQTVGKYYSKLSDHAPSPPPSPIGGYSPLLSYMGGLYICYKEIVSSPLVLLCLAGPALSFRHTL